MKCTFSPKHFYWAIWNKLHIFYKNNVTNCDSFPHLPCLPYKRLFDSYLKWACNPEIQLWKIILLHQRHRISTWIADNSRKLNIIYLTAFWGNYIRKSNEEPWKLISRSSQQTSSNHSFGHVLFCASNFLCFPLLLSESPYHSASRKSHTGGFWTQSLPKW